jgi:hypothetical protein
MVSWLVGKILNGTIAILILPKDPHLFAVLSQPQPPYAGQQHHMAILLH